MIYLYTGTPGSGKSLHIASDIYHKLKKGKWVFANFDINYDYFKDKKGCYSEKKGTFIFRNNEIISPDWFMNFSRQFFSRDKKGRICEGQALLVIDEAQCLFDSRSWQFSDRKKWINFFTQHRKLGYDIVLITQFDRLIDKQIRCLTEYEIKHRKVNNFKLLGRIFARFMGGTLFVAITNWYGAKEKISSEFFSGRKYFDFYDSYKMFN